MKKDNEAKMKEILSELEEELHEEKLENKKVEEEVKEKASSVKESKEDVKKTVVKEEKDEIVKEKIKEDKKEKKKKVDIDDDSELQVEESPIRKIGKYLIDKIKEYKYVLILDLAVFLFLFFVIPMVILEVKPVFWMTLFLIFTILPTVAFYLKKLFKKYQVIIGIPFFYLCILCILDSCTIKDLYGITSHGTLDKTPAWIDAILVTFIIVFFQYIGLLVIDVAKKYLKCNKKKEK